MCPTTLLNKSNEIILYTSNLYHFNIISYIKDAYDAKVTIVTNGFIEKEQYESLRSIVENFQVSLYGFSDSAVKLISKIRLDIVRSFCEYISSRQHSLDVKFVMSPMVIHELIPFLEWSLCLNVAHVMVYYAILPTKDYETSGRRDVSSFEHLVPEYWNPIMDRLSCEVKSFFIQNKQIILNKGINYIINHDVLDILHISSSFLSDLGIPQEKSISISCKAWKPLLEKSHYE